MTLERLPSHHIGTLIKREFSAVCRIPLSLPAQTSVSLIHADGLRDRSHVIVQNTQSVHPRSAQLRARMDDPPASSVLCHAD